MNPDVFFENFELLADAPNGVQKLRELILQLAVRGKLVPQDPNDEPASVLLEKIKAEKKKLSEKGNLKNDSLPLIENGEVLFEIPQSWEWVRLGEVINYNGAQKVSSEDIPDDAWVLDLEDIEKNTSKILNHVYFKDKKSKSTKAKFNKGDVLYGKLRPYLNKVVVAEDNGYCTTEIVPLRIYTGIDPYYLMYSLKRPDFIEYVNSKTYGTKMPRLGTEDARKSLFPLPPLAEQKRIVSKVDELMALCDKLETRRQKKQEIQSKLNGAALDRMLSAENHEEFEQHWQRICENFDLLYDNPENVERLRQAILQLAVQGKLVPQNPEDEPASVLIEKINSDKKNLIKAGKIKATKSLSLLEATDDVPTLPEKWELVNLDSIILFMDAGWSPACRNHPTEDEDTWGVLKTTSVQPLMFLWAEHKQLPENLTPRPEYEVKIGDILITRAGPKNRVGICCLVKDTRSRLMISDKIIRFHLLDEFVFPEFITLCLNTGFSQSYIESQKSGMAESQMNISQNKLRMTPILLPPLEEQKRIVEKVEQLMGLCDELEAKLRKEREDSEKLMEAVVKGLLEDTATEKPELDKLIPLQAAAIKLK